MAETKAEDDDEEGFGDFTFASFPNQITVHSDQINSRISTTTDDDEWGDFVEYPSRSDLSSGISHTQSPPISSEPSKPFDPFGFSQDHSTKPSQSMPTVPSRVESERTQWVKPKGALPLSLFGDEEDEDDKSDVVDPSVVDAKDSSADKHVASNGFSSKSSEVDIGFDFKPLTVAQNGFSSDSYSKSEQSNIENGLNSDPVVGSADSSESFGEFKYSFSESGLKQGEEPKVNDLSHSEVGLLSFDGKTQGNEFRSENHIGALPLSIFGDEELETDDSLNSKDIFIQAPQIPSVDSTQKPTENGFNSVGTVSDLNLVNGDDDFDDSSWEFKDGSSQTGAKDQTSLLSPGDAHHNYSNKLKLDNYVDFYCRLKDELCFVARCHLDSLKKARNAASLSGEDVKVAALDVEIQEACKELRQQNIISNDVYSEDHPVRDICLNTFLEVLNEPKFQVLESEYDLLRRLQLAEKDFRSAIELMKHATSILNVLLLGSMEEQTSYISTWSKMASVSAEELKHGAWIWKQSSEKNVQTQILSEPRGKQFIFALGEVYRVVAVIGASARLYKPWILSSSVDRTSIYALLEECYAIWSHSGLEEALRSMSDPIDVEYDRKVTALLESIKYIHDLHELTLGDHVFSPQESICQLSALPLGAVPDMKTVVWNGEHYFLTLANLWANLISCDPPNLPRIHSCQPSDLPPPKEKMLDINLFREDKENNPEAIRESQRRRFANVDLVDEVICLDKEWRQRQFELDNLRKDFNKINKEVARLKIAGDDATEMIRNTEENKQLIANKELEVQDARAALYSKLEIIGNLVHDSVPVSNDEANNAIIRSWGEKRLEPKLKNHVEVVELLGIADTKKGSNVAGGRGFYLKGDGVRLNQALINFGLDFLEKRGYTLLQTPFFMRKDIMAKCAQLAQFDEELYKVTGEGDDKYLIATSEQPLCAYHLEDWIHPSQLPLRYAGYSSCFRKEAGSHGRDTLGIFRVHQFEKVEQFCITSPNGNESWDMHEEMIKNSEEFYKMLNIPYQVVAIVSGALNDAAAKKYDLEGWFPASNTYRELVSCSNCTDYQSRRMEIRYGQKKGNEQAKQYVHMLNSTLTATERTMCCILENYQKEDGVEIPEVLQQFMGGKTFLPFKTHLPFKTQPAKEVKGKNK
ncbi:hypothetical protein F0562_029356 [Nyssa sinensis]|uniref:serine--tRNA ligase n=1 Tax=Nyssa sinensis TaxID=561372 RepID=A0A5J5B2L6_9ASTE|nr:hypothetical protein F0562_029356 [Nyssa sinensis]